MSAVLWASKTEVEVRALRRGPEAEVAPGNEGQHDHGRDQGAENREHVAGHSGSHRRRFLPRLLWASQSSTRSTAAPMTTFCRENWRLKVGDFWSGELA